MTTPVNGAALWAHSTTQHVPPVNPPASEASLLDVFAGHAMSTVAALMAAGLHAPGPNETRGADFIAASAYRLADAMLRARDATLSQRGRTE